MCNDRFVGFPGMRGNTLAIVVGILVALALVTCPQIASAADGGTFDSFYKAAGGIPWWGWTLIALGAVAAAAACFFSGGTASPAVAAVGTWIGGMVGLHGAAATSFGLALLGGGSIASGGLGMAGGAALLTGIFTFGTGVVIEVASDTLLTAYSNQSFQNDSKNMTTLPFPINEEGGKAYTETLAFIKQHPKLDSETVKNEDGEEIKVPKPFTGGDNLAIMREAISKMRSAMNANPETGWKRVKNHTFLAMMYFQIGDYENARIQSKKTIEVADEEYEREKKNAWFEFTVKYQETGVAKLILATSSLYDGEFQEETAKEFMEAVLSERKSSLVPIMYATFFDRIKYLHQCGDISYDFYSSLIYDTINHEKVKTRPANLMLITSRLLLEAEETRLAIETVTKREEDIFMNSETIGKLRKNLKCHKEALNLLSVASGALLSMKDEIKIPKPKEANGKDVGMTPKTISDRVHEYQKKVESLEKSIDKYEGLVKAKNA